MKIDFGVKNISEPNIMIGLLKQNHPFELVSPVGEEKFGPFTQRDFPDGMEIHIYPDSKLAYFSKKDEKSLSREDFKTILKIAEELYIINTSYYFFMEDLKKKIPQLVN